MLQRSSRVLALILVLMCSRLGCQASDKNIKTASAVVTNILTVPQAAVEEAISEEADDVNALHEAYRQVMGEYAVSYTHLAHVLCIKPVCFSCALLKPFCEQH